MRAEHSSSDVHPVVAARIGLHRPVEKEDEDHDPNGDEEDGDRGDPVAWSRPAGAEAVLQVLTDAIEHGEEGEPDDNGCAKEPLSDRRGVSPNLWRGPIAEGTLAHTVTFTLPNM